MSVKKDNDKKTWVVQLWYKDFTGKRKHTTKRGFATKREAEKWEREFLCTDKLEDITIGEITKRFFNNLQMKVVSGEIQDTTFANKEIYKRNYLLPYFENTIAAKVTTDDVNIWITELITNYETVRGNRLASGTIKGAKQLLSQVYEYGIANRLVKENPVIKANKISFYSNDKRVKWTQEQFTLFHNKMVRYPAPRLVFDIIFASGLRIGEVLALTPADITPYKLSIVKGVVRLANKGTIQHKPKTDSSTRDVQIPRGLYFQIADYIRNIDGLKTTDRIFPFTAQYCRYCMKTLEEEMGLPHTSPHMLRHLYASMIYAETKDLTVIASQLGHASIDVTAKVYVDMIKGNDRATVDRLDNILTIK